jgi:beta-glucosidase
MPETADQPALPDAQRFPDGFIWGVATAAHQVEGGNINNQWYAWEEKGGILSGDHCGLACDWWEHAEEDFDRARDLHVNGMRLSLEWSRIEPEPGRWNDAANARYRQMLEGLRARGIEPLVTLHHFTNPLWLEQQGGFANESVIAHFARYARHCVEVFGDLCDFWCTVNEPNVYATLGYLLGIFPPGQKGDTIGSVRVQARLLRAHAAAYHAIHAAQPHARVGLAHHMRIFDPARRRNPFDRFVANLQDGGFNALVLDALRFGRARGVLALLAGDLSAVRGTYDYVGVNYYTREVVQVDLHNPGEMFGRRFSMPGSEQMDQNYGEIYPHGMFRVLERLAALGKPIYVTESGFADNTDRLRPKALVRTVLAMRRAIARGAPVRGFYHWTLVDNFEWAEGWRMRFGLIALDPVTQQRTPRGSAAVYAAICAANGVPSALLEQLGIPQRARG